ncbi:MAG TPA: hypothetical protein VE988_28080, partial [Gemmataceae bacterium]|nr:hypothetical protein [Gemmataceae bacterium]
GLIILHYRKAKGGITYEVKSTVKLPATVKLERHGDIFSVSAAKPGGEFQPVGAVTVKLQEPVHAGIFLCAHDNSVTESAIFTNLGFQNIKPGKKRVQETSLEVMSVDTGERKVIYKAREKFEAPNWSRDGKLYFNKGGAIYTVPVSGGKPVKLDTGDATNCNNDHGLSPDGKSLVISHNVKGASQFSIIPSTGGAPKRLTTAKESCYWHGWSPDGKTLAYVGQTGKTYNIFTMPVEGGPAKQLTTDMGTTDGPDYTPDGQYIYFNSDRTGDMRIWRMNADGSSPQQITKDANYSDWFPHPSPDGKMLVWLSFDKTVKDHPANKDVVLRIMPLAGGKTRTIATLFGGQGTINVPSWSPDSKQIAFVSYIPILP